jgi:hypothetical protein
MKKTFFKSILCASLFVGALTSCNEVEDLYNPALVREKAKQALGLDIAPDQDWNMTSIVTANITLNEDALSDYSFRIYTANPTSNANAVILAEESVKTDTNGKASASFKFEMPSYLKLVYVARVDSHGRRMIGISNVQDGVVSKAFGESSLASTKAITDYELPTMDAPYTKDEVNSLIASSTDINNIELYDNKIRIIGNVVVNSSVNGTIDFNAFYYFGASNPAKGSNKLIINNGVTVEITNTQFSGMDIIVTEGATLKVNGLIKMQDNARIIVMEGGSVINEYDASAQDNEQNVNINYSDGSVLIYNAGSMNIGLFNASNGGKFYNAPTGVLKAKTINFSNANDELYNWGKIDAGKIVGNYGGGEGQGILHNGCLIRCDDIRVLQLNLNANSAFELNNLSANNIYLREYSIVRCNTFSSNNPYFQYVGVEGQKALISTQHVKNINLNTWNGAPRQIGDNIYFESNTYENDWIKQCFEIIMSRTNTGLFVVGEAPLIITAEKADEIKDAACVGNGNTPKDEVIEEILGNSNIYAFEDMSIDGGDYDMNDVVLKCTKLENNQISIELLAAGATKKVYVFFRDTRTNTVQNLFGEVHEALLGYSNNLIINTGVDENNVPTKEVIIDVEEGFLFSQHGDIYVVDDKNRESHIPTFTEGFQPGDAPYAICVPTTWRYPKEWVNITVAYPDFRRWAIGEDDYANWFSNPLSGKIY